MRWLVLVLLAGCTSPAMDDPGGGPDDPGGAGLAWSRGADAPGARTEVAVAQDGPLVHVLGGFDGDGAATASHFTYDTENESWAEGPPLPVPVHHAAAAVVDGTVYLFGGYMGTDFLATDLAYALAPGAQTWRPITPLPEARGAHGAAVVDERIVLVGGVGSGGLARSSLVYDPGEQAWSPAPGLSSPREHLGVTALDGLVYAAGGRTGGLDTNVAALEAFDLSTGEWTSLADAPTPRGGVAAAAWNGSVVLIGGEAPDGTFGEVEAYDPATDTWRALPDMPTPRHGLGAAAWDGALHALLGGPEQGLSVSGAVEILAPG